MKLLLSFQMNVFGRHLDVSLRQTPSPALIVALHPVEPPKSDIMSKSGKCAVIIRGGAAQPINTNRIGAIKALRSAMNIGLKEAKDAIDAVEHGDVNLGKMFQMAWTPEDARKLVDTMVREACYPRSQLTITAENGGAFLADKVMEIVEHGEGGSCNRCNQARALIAADRLNGI